MQPANVELKEEGSIKLWRKKSLSHKWNETKQNKKKTNNNKKNTTKKGREEQMKTKTISVNRNTQKNPPQPNTMQHTEKRYFKDPKSKG